MSDIKAMNAVTAQDYKPQAKDAAKAKVKPQDPKDAVSIENKPKKEGFFKKLGKDIIKLRKNKLGRFATDVAIGAAGGAAIVALALSPAALGVAGAVVGGVVAGGVGAALGGFGGWLVGGMSGGPDRASKWGKRGAIAGGLMMGGLGAVGGGLGAAAEGLIITKLAAYVGGGPAGGAVAGASLGAAESLYSIATDTSSSEKPQI